MYKTAGMIKCLPCQEGTVSANSGATVCSLCDVGQQANSYKTHCGKLQSISSKLYRDGKKLSFLFEV